MYSPNLLQQHSPLTPTTFSFPELSTDFPTENPEISSLSTASVTTHESMSSVHELPRDIIGMKSIVGSQNTVVDHLTEANDMIIYSPSLPQQHSPVSQSYKTIDPPQLNITSDEIPLVNPSLSPIHVTTGESMQIVNNSSKNMIKMKSLTKPEKILVNNIKTGKNMFMYSPKLLPQPSQLKQDNNMVTVASDMSVNDNMFMLESDPNTNNQQMYTKRTMEARRMRDELRLLLPRNAITYTIRDLMRSTVEYIKQLHKAQKTLQKKVDNMTKTTQNLQQRITELEAENTQLDEENWKLEQAKTNVFKGCTNHNIGPQNFAMQPFHSSNSGTNCLPDRSFLPVIGSIDTRIRNDHTTYNQLQY